MVDPVTLLAIGGLASAGAGIAGNLLAPKPPNPTVPNAPPPVSQPQGSTTSNKPAGTPSFLAAAAAPQSQNVASKSLLGQ